MTDDCKNKYYRYSNYLLLSIAIALLSISLLWNNIATAQALDEFRSTHAKKPNIVIFLADDLGWADVGYRGSPIQTPNIDSLAREGAQLHRFYSTPICTPTRAALMTGRDPVRLGLAYSVILPWQNHGLHGDEHLMPESFRASGYQTAIIGKWHLGHSQQNFHPNSRGFDHFYGHLHTEVGYFPPFANLKGKDFQSNGKSIDDSGYETFLLAAEARRWIRKRDKSRPFFLYIPFIAPHTPLDAPQKLKDKYSDLKDNREPSRSNADNVSRLARLRGVDSLRQIYAAVVDAMDQAVGTVLDTLEEEGLTENTIVLFFSDNGGQVVYGVGGAYNYPLRGGKSETYDGGIRVPALIKWPGVIPAGIRIDQMITVMDLFPTLAAAAKVPVLSKFELDGLNFWPAIVDGKHVERAKPVIFGSEIPIFGSLDFSVFSGQWKMVRQMERDQDTITIETELFNIVKDPEERDDLSKNYPEQVQKMVEVLRNWRQLYPSNGVRAQLMPPPGWRAPKDWADYTIPADQLQGKAAPGMPPKRALAPLDRQYGERGRLIYNCEPRQIIGGGGCANRSNAAPQQPKRPR